MSSHTDGRCLTGEALFLTFRALMRPFHPHIVVGYDRMFSALGDPASFDDVIRTEKKEEFLLLVSNFRGECQSFDLKASLVTLDKIASMAKQDGCTFADIRPLWDELRGRFHDELQGCVCIALSSIEASLIEQKEPVFGPEVHARLPRAVPELVSVGHCLAFQLSTAAVFHILRAVEVAMYAMARNLGYQWQRKQDRSWGNILKEMRAKIDTKYPANDRAAEDDRAYFEQAYQILSALKVAFRDSTMHVESTFLPAEAMQIGAMAQAFMHRIASRMDENGALIQPNPKPVP
jgi:hypothetical protein